MRVEWELPPGVGRQLLVVAGVVVLVAAGYWWFSAPVQSTPVEEPKVVVSAGSAASSRVLVDVVGAVRHPGVVRLPSDARVIDAVAAAGGVLPGHPPVINMARKVVDGEQIIVGVGSTPSGQGGGGGGRINVNTATAAQLDALPGIGAVLAQRIVEHRTRNGPFRQVRDLLDVPGIGDAKYADIADAVSVA